MATGMETWLKESQPGALTRESQYQSKRELRPSNTKSRFQANTAPRVPNQSMSLSNSGHEMP